MNWPEAIILSRTDGIGDTVLSLPMAVEIKRQSPKTKVIYLCRKYCEAVAKCQPAVDEIWIWDADDGMLEQPHLVDTIDVNQTAIVHVFPKKELAKWAKAVGIKTRIGTSHRLFHLLTCNKRPNFSRKNSDLHEAQLNFKLLSPFGVVAPEMDSVIPKAALTAPNSEISIDWSSLAIAFDKLILLHPKSMGSAVEWPMEKYVDLAKRLMALGYQVGFTGTEKEGALIKSYFKDLGVIDFTGKLALEQLIWLISRGKGLVAASTGPLHLAAAFGKTAVGLFSARRPIHPGRWMPLGPSAHYLLYDENCSACKAGKSCKCIADITVGHVIEKLTA